VIRRDSNGPNWDDLKLVNISPLRFLFGKWWAAFYRVRGWMVALGIMQMVLVGIMMSHYLMWMYKEHVYSCHFDITRHNDYGSYYCVIEWDDNFKSWQTWSPLLIPLSISSAITLSIIEMMASTAIGVAFGLLLRGNLLGLLFGLIARTAPVIYYSTWPNEYSSQYYIAESEIWAWRWYEYTWFSLADGGTTAIMRMIVTPGWFDQYGRSPEGIFTALAAGFGLLALLFMGAMFVSWLVLIARGFRGSKLLSLL
jgi:hypothetical protein